MKQDPNSRYNHFSEPLISAAPNHKSQLCGAWAKSAPREAVITGYLGLPRMG